MDINLSIAFVFGVLSFFSPCVLPLVPGYLAIFSDIEKNIRIRLIGSIQFTFGFTLVFISLAAIATNIGSFFSRNSQSLSIVSGLVIIVFGLILFFPNLNQRYFYSANYVDLNKFKNYKNFILGLTFAFGFTPCIGPVLGALLTLSSSSQTVNEGIFLLSGYSLGLAIPFISMPILSTKINLKGKLFTIFQQYSNKISGSILIIIGLLISSDRMYLLASLFQDLFIYLNLDWLSTI
jgi:cytochrome c-type biogenesis protein